ncbi:MAG: hypothetical protein P1V20_04010 [Verrucomicrobiales bacterium]|nr:hypothetical protein [Verrucomicrobiales bacterium]
MKTLPLRSLSLIFSIIAIAEGIVSVSACAEDSERDMAIEKAYSAAKAIELRISELEDQDFSDLPAGREKGYGNFPVSLQSTYRECLHNDLKAAFAEIDLAKQFPDSNLDESAFLNLLIDGKRQDFFGTEGHLKNASFLEKARILEKLLLDEELRFGDRLFLLPGSGNEGYQKILEKWVMRIRDLAGEGYLGSEEGMSVAQQAKCIRTLQLFGFVLESRLVQDFLDRSPGTRADLEKFLDVELRGSLKKYVRRRFVNDGPLRDRSLPLLSVGKSFLPGLTFESAGVTTHSNYKKLALSHARGLASLVEAIDSPMANTNLARKSIGKIIDYRIKPFYLGSTDIRERGTFPCEPDGELEIILREARFFGDNGHTNGEVYRKRVQVLEHLFLQPSSAETLDFLLALKQPGDWIEYFHQTVIGDKKHPDSCLKAIEKGEIRPLHLKNLFLARCILSHRAFDTTSELRNSRDSIKAVLLERAPDLAVELFKQDPEGWYDVDIAFTEISKLVPDFDLAALSIPTYETYLNQRRDYDWAIESLPRDLLSLSDPETNGLLANEVGLFQSDYVYRTGKFNKRLNPEMIKKVNQKLRVILDYRHSRYTPPDDKERPGLQKRGAAMRELLVGNRYYPGDELTNTHLHDLLEGPKGGFGGLGKLFECDPQGYESMETTLDAIASCKELNLGDALFEMAMDVGVEEPTASDKAAAAKKWLNYFRKTQSIARFHSTPEQLTEAIRGAFVCRLVVQSEPFIEAMENSPEVGVGSSEDVSSVLENTLSTQVRIMNSILLSVDPSTALNKNIDHIKGRWYELKGWHTESIKWLEAIVADPVLMSEVSRIRNLSRDKSNTSYDIAPSIARIEQTLTAVEPRIIAERNMDRHDEMFKPLDFANLVMGQLVTLQKSPMGITYIEPEAEVPSAGKNSKDNLAEEVTHQLFADIRNAVAEAGFEELSKVNSLTEFPAITREYYSNSGFRKRSEDVAIHELLLHQMKGAVAKAKGRIEAERVTDLNQLEDLTIRASRADRIFYAGDPDRYSLLIDPSFLLHEWNNRHKIETIAEFRTVETRAQAQTQIFRFRKEREKLEELRKEIADQQEELETRLKLAREWAEKNEYEFDPDSVIDQMLSMEDRINSLQNDIAGYHKMEEKYRQHHVYLAQQLQSYKMGNNQFNREKTRDYLLAQAKIDPLPDPEPVVVGIIKKPAPEKNYSKPKPTARRTSTPARTSSRSSSSRSRGFFSRIFRRR